MPLVDEHVVRDLFDAVLASSIDPIMISRPDGAILRANPAACRALGRTETEIGRVGRQGITVATPGLERLGGRPRPAPGCGGAPRLRPPPTAGRDDPVEAGLALLARPFTGGELLERIRRALDRRG